MPRLAMQAQELPIILQPGKGIPNILRGHPGHPEQKRRRKIKEVFAGPCSCIYLKPFGNKEHKSGPDDLFLKFRHALDRIEDDEKVFGHCQRCGRRQADITSPQTSTWTFPKEHSGPFF